MKYLRIPQNDIRWRVATATIMSGVLLVAWLLLRAFSTLEAQAASVGNYTTSRGTLIRVFHCVDSLAETADGYWIDTHGFSELSIHVEGISTATLQVRGSNNVVAKPAGSDDEFQVGSNITSDGITTVTTVPFYTKIKCSAYTSGTIDVFLMGKGF